MSNIYVNAIEDDLFIASTNEIENINNTIDTIIDFIDDNTNDSFFSFNTIACFDDIKLIDINNYDCANIDNNTIVHSISNTINKVKETYVFIYLDETKTRHVIFITSYKYVFNYILSYDDLICEQCNLHYARIETDYKQYIFKYLN